MAYNKKESKFFDNFLRMLFFIAFYLNLISADEHNHKYKNKEEVVVWANTVGPYANRQETYAFFNLPYCMGTALHQHHHGSFCLICIQVL